jgi:hypothetical protein
LRDLTQGHTRFVLLMKTPRPTPGGGLIFVRFNIFFSFCCPKPIS